MKKIRPNTRKFRIPSKDSVTNISVNMKPTKEEKKENKKKTKKTKSKLLNIVNAIRLQYLFKHIYSSRLTTFFLNLFYVLIS